MTRQNPGNQSAYALFNALQWADTAFPSGRYTLSGGLEGLAGLGVVEAMMARAPERKKACELFTTDSLTSIMSTIIAEQVAPVDLLAHFLTFRATTIDRITQICHHVTAARPTDSARRASTRVGRQLIDMAQHLDVTDPLVVGYANEVRAGRADGNQAVAAALIDKANGLDEVMAARTESFALLASMASAALRLRLADHITAQIAVSRTVPCLEKHINATIERIDNQTSAGIDPLEFMGALSPIFDIATARHETAPARLFIA